MQGVANAVYYLVTYIGQVNPREGHEAQGELKLYVFIIYPRG
jgi:hypothetical protein